MISKIVWYGIAHHELNTDTTGQKMELVQNDVKDGLHWRFYGTSREKIYLCNDSDYSYHHWSIFDHVQTG